MEVELKVDDITAAHKAALKGDRDELEEVLKENGTLMDSPDYFGRTPLMYCVLADRLNTAKCLLRLGAQVSSVDNVGRSAAHIAAHKGSIKFLQLLVAKNCQFSLPDKDGQTPLHLATNRRITDGSCVKYILKAMSSDYIDVQNHQGQSALHCASYFANVEAVRLLLKASANPDIGDSKGKTPLHFCAGNTQADAVLTSEVLLEKGSSSLIDWQDHEGRTALHVAVKAANKSVASLLIAKGCDVNLADNLSRTALHWAAQLGRADFIQELIDGDVDVHAQDCNGATALHYAAAAGSTSNHQTSIQLLLKHGVNVDVKDETGATPLMWAASRGADFAIEKLIHSGGEIQAVDNDGNSALHAAAAHGKSLSVSALISRGADTQASNHDGQTALFGALQSGSLSTVKNLADNASPEEIFHQDNFGSTALHFAAEAGHADVIEYIARLANAKNMLRLEIKDSSGQTALHVASENGKANSMAALLEWGADVDAQDENGYTPLHLAARSNHVAAMRLLLQYHAFINSMTFSIERETPLDMAFEADHQDAIAILINLDALVGEDVKHLAASKIQRAWRRYSENLKEEKQKFLMLKQEHLRRDADEIRRIRIASMSKATPEINENKKLEQVVSTFVPVEAPPPNPIRVSIGTQTELKTKTHQTQTPRKLSSVKVEGILFREEIPIDSEKLDKALRYSGESPEAFARHLFGTVPGARHHLLKQARRRHEYVQRSAQAAVIIQAWWRRKKRGECHLDDLKKDRLFSRNPWNTETPKPRIVANSDGVKIKDALPKKRHLPALNSKSSTNCEKTSGDSRASKSNSNPKDKKKKARKNRVFPSVTSDDIKKKSKPSKSLSSVSTRSSADRRTIPQSITSKIYSSMWKH